MKKSRSYFYSVDLQGRLFLEDTRPKNIATSIKDPKFLDFFFRRVRRINSKDQEFMTARGIPIKDYPFVSICGKEMNWIRPAATPIVFHTLKSERDPKLIFGGTLMQSFRPSQLAVSCRTGWMYHQLDSIPSSLEESSTPEYGLVRSAVAVALSENIISHGDNKLAFDSGVTIEPIEFLPQEAEPGDWALPFSDESNIW